MIRSEKEYTEAVERLRKDKEVLALQKEKLEGLELSEEEVRRALGPMLSFRAQLEEEVEWYERVRRRDFGIIRDLSTVDALLIALRIANGLSRGSWPRSSGGAKRRSRVTSATSTTGSRWTVRRGFWTP